MGIGHNTRICCREPGYSDLGISRNEDIKHNHLQLLAAAHGAEFALGAQLSADAGAAVAAGQQLLAAQVAGTPVARRSTGQHAPPLHPQPPTLRG